MAHILSGPLWVDDSCQISCSCGKTETRRSRVRAEAALSYHTLRDDTDISKAEKFLLIAGNRLGEAALTLWQKRTREGISNEEALSVYGMLHDSINDQALALNNLRRHEKAIKTLIAQGEQRIRDAAPEKHADRMIEVGERAVFSLSDLRSLLS